MARSLHFLYLTKKHNTLIPLIRQQSKRCSLYYTDDTSRKKEYVRDHATYINGIEEFSSYAKTWLYHYRGVPK